MRVNRRIRFEYALRVKGEILESGKNKLRIQKYRILGFHVTPQALLKLVSAMLVSLGCQIYANNGLRSFRYKVVSIQVVSIQIEVVSIHM